MDLVIVIATAALVSLWLPVIVARKASGKTLYSSQVIMLMLAQPLLVAMLLFLFEAAGLLNPMGLIVGTLALVSMSGYFVAKNL